MDTPTFSPNGPPLPTVRTTCEALLRSMISARPKNTPGRFPRPACPKEQTPIGTPDWHPPATG